VTSRGVAPKQEEREEREYGFCGWQPNRLPFSRNFLLRISAMLLNRRNRGWFSWIANQTDSVPPELLFESGWLQESRDASSPRGVRRDHPAVRGRANGIGLREIDAGFLQLFHRIVIASDFKSVR